MSHIKLIPLCFFVFMGAWLHASDRLPDLISADPKPIVKPVFKEEPVHVSSQISVLQDLEQTISKLGGLEEVEKWRLISLLQEMQKRYPDAYLNFQKIEKKHQNKLWYKAKSLYLAEKLGLEDELIDLVSEIKSRYLKSKLEIKKCLFCNSVKKIWQI